MVSHGLLLAKSATEGLCWRNGGRVLQVSSSNSSLNTFALI